MAKLSESQQDVLIQIEAGGRLVEDETGAPWIEDSHGGRRRIRRPTLELLQRGGYLNEDQMTLPRILVSTAGNVDWWQMYLLSIFAENLSGDVTRRKDLAKRAAVQIVGAMKETARTARLYIPENRE